jgi:UDPglucose 6-dehydrogenase
LTTVGHRLAVLGAGYVGLTTAACLASLGHRVRCVDRDARLVDRLRAGQVDILEPELPGLVTHGLATSCLRFELDLQAAVRSAELTFLCLPTPAGPGGTPDLSIVMTVMAQIASALPPGSAVVIKSTVPPGTAARLAAVLSRPDVAVISNPEFLREGSAVEDFLRPDRIVVGCDADGAGERVVDLYAKLAAPVVLTSTASAELAKYAANCFLAVKLSYLNELTDLCELTGADIGEVAEILGYDARIGASYLRSGPGWGGPCLPKDTAGLLQIGTAAGTELGVLRAAIEANQRQQRTIVSKLRLALGGTLAGARIALLGLAFKAGTGDLRESPAIAIATQLTAEQAQVIGYDPAVRGTVAGIVVTDDPYQAATGADAIVLVTDWPEFSKLDWNQIRLVMKGDLVVDPRNQLEPAVIHQSGLRWRGTGRVTPGLKAGSDAAG